VVGDINICVVNFISFLAIKHLENRLRFDKVAESVKVGTFLRQCKIIGVGVKVDGD